MTVFETSVFEQAQQLARISREEAEGELASTPGFELAVAQERQRRDEVWSRIEQRFAIVIVQARAAECRTQSGYMLLNQGDILRTVPEEHRGAVSAAMTLMAHKLTERSHLMEKVGAAWAKSWPPDSAEPTEPVDAVTVEPGPGMIQ